MNVCRVVDRRVVGCVFVGCAVVRDAVVVDDYVIAVLIHFARGTRVAGGNDGLVCC